MAEEIRFNELANVGELSPSAIVAIVQEQQGELVSLQCSAAQIADLIVNGIQFQALTSEDKKIIGAINEVLAKVDDLELFKFPNATIIGAPTINNGQISGFSQTSYLQFPFLMDFQGRHFAINMEFTTAADVTNQQNIFDSDFGLAFAIRSGKFVIAVSSNGTSWNIGEGVGSHTVLSNTTYRVQLAWDGTAYKLAYSVNGGESYTEDISLASTVSPFPKQVYIGVGENYASVLNFFKGIINLNYASLYVADSLVWQGMDDVGLASRLATDLSNIDAAGEQRIKDIAGGGGGDVTKAYVDAQDAKLQEQLDGELAEIQYLKGNVWNAIAHGCKNDLSADCSTILQNAINSSPDGTVFYFPQGKYLLSRTITINNRNNITICGDDLGFYGATVFFSNYQYSTFSINGGNGIKFKNISIYGTETIHPSVAIIFTDNTPTTMDSRVINSVIDGVRIQNYKNGIRFNAPSGYNIINHAEIKKLDGGTGISIGENYNNTGVNEFGEHIVPNYIYISNCYIDNISGTGLYGIALYTCQMIYLQNNDICNFNSGTAIYISNNNNTSRKIENIYIHNNSIYKNKNGIICYSRVNNYTIHDVDISNNMITGIDTSSVGMRFFRTTNSLRNISVVNNHITNAIVDTSLCDEDTLFKVGIGIKSNEIELIEHITLTSPSTRFDRNSEPNGSPYAFEKVLILINTNSTEAILGNYVGFSPNSDYTGLNRIFVDGNSDTNVNKHTMVEFDRGTINACAFTNEEQGIVKTKIMSTSTTSIDTVVKSIRVDTPLPVGAEITILGIRV